MNQHNTLFRALTRLTAPTELKQVEAVASAIGCPEFTTPEGCNRKGECWCATAAARVVELERTRA